MTALDVITLDEAKAFLKIDFDDEDQIITDCIYSAVAIIEDKTQQRLYQREEVVVTGLCDYQYFPGPVNNIVGVTNQDGVSVTNYKAVRWPIRINLYFGYQTKFIGDLTESIEPMRTITIDVGYAERSKIPNSLLAAVRQLVAFLYENRNETSVDIPNNIQMAMQMHNRAPLL